MISAGTSIEVVAERGDWRYGYSAADNDWGWYHAEAFTLTVRPTTSTTRSTAPTTRRSNVDCSRWYSPVAAERVDSHRRSTQTVYEPRRRPDAAPGCVRGQVIGAGTSIQIVAQRGQWFYGYSAADNDWGWYHANAFDADPPGSTTVPPTTGPSTTAPTTQPPSTTRPGGRPQNAEQNLELLRSTRHRNANHDSSPYLDTPSADLPMNEFLVSWREYANNGGLTQPIANSSAFRVYCEFSHFAYDDPIVRPNEPGATHLHLFFGNTEANAFSTADSILNTGSSTCNGQELNRTGYWIPAVIDQNGNLPIPDDILIYYKAYADAIGDTQPYPAGMRLVSGNAMASSRQPAALREIFYRCFDRSIGAAASPKYAAMPDCPRNTILEMTVRFQTCWNGRDAANYRANASYSDVWPTSGSCPRSHPIRLPQLEYRVFFSDHHGSGNWILSSDVNMADKRTVMSDGYSLHGDWFGGWHDQTNRMWINNCVNVVGADCDEGLLADPRRGNSNAQALRFRPQYNGPSRVSGADILADLCTTNKRFSGPASVAYCN